MVLALDEVEPDIVPVGEVLSTTTGPAEDAEPGAVLPATSATEFWLNVRVTAWPSWQPETGIV